MLARPLALAALLLTGACAYDAGYHESNYAREPQSVAGYYSPVGYTAPYVAGSPVYGPSPYVNGPVAGGIYIYGDDRDRYGGPLFSPYHGISCDRRRQLCWDRSGPDTRWSNRFFGRWHNGNGGWHRRGGQNWGASNPNNVSPWVYQVPLDPDGSGAPAFQPNGCGGNGQPPC